MPEETISLEKSQARGCQQYFPKNQLKESKFQASGFQLGMTVTSHYVFTVDSAKRFIKVTRKRSTKVMQCLLWVQSIPQLIFCTDK